MSTAVQTATSRRRIPAWLWYSLLTIVLWGAWGVQSKVAVDRVSPWMNQILFPLGLIPASVPVLASCKLRADANLSRGAAYGFITGILGGAGNIAFFLSLDRGGIASIVVPLTCMAPLVTVLLAAAALRERINRVQGAGVAVALVAAYLLSV